MFIVSVLLAANAICAATLSKVTIARDPSKVQSPQNSIKYARARHGLGIALDGEVNNLSKRSSHNQESLPDYSDELYTCIGTLGNGQKFAFDLDTGSSDVWIRGKFCVSKEIDSGCSGGPTFDVTDKTVARTNSKFNTSYGDGSSVSGLVYYGRGSLAGVGGKFNFGVTTAESGMRGPNDGLWGLAYSSLNQIENGNYAEASGITSFSFYLSNWINGDAGELTINGADSTMYTGNMQYIPISSDSYYQFNPTGGNFTVNGVTTKIINGENGAIADTGTTLLLVPTLIASTLNKQIGAGNYSTSSGVFPIDCGILNTGPKITFALQHISIEIGPQQYVISRKDGTCFSGISDIGSISSFSGPAYIFGDTFLRAAYTMYDIANNRLGFAQAIHPTAIVNNLTELVQTPATKAMLVKAATNSAVRAKKWISRVSIFFDQ